MRYNFCLLIALCAAFFCNSAPAAAGKPADGERLLLIRSVGPASEKSVVLSGVYDSMVEFLTDRGYRVVDRQAAEQAAMQIAATHEIDPVLNKAAAYGLKFLAEYTIHFKTSTIVKNPERGIGALVRVSAKVVDNTGARIITAKAAEASSTGLSPDDAMEKAARAAGKKTIEQLVKGLEQHVVQTGHEGRTLTMVFEGKESLLLNLLNTVERMPSVAAAKETESGGGKATFEIICKTRRDQFEQELLKAASQQGTQLQKIRSEGNRSTWKIR